MATNGVIQEKENVENIGEVFSELRLALESLRKEEFTWDEDINFLQSFLCDQAVKAVADVNDGVAKSQSFEQPVGPSKESCMEILDRLEQNKGEEATELMELLKKPVVKSMLSVHDTVRTRAYESPVPPFDRTTFDHRRNKRGHEYRTVGLHKSANETLGITLKLVNDKLVIARILHGGLIHRQGLLQVGDKIREVNDESVSSMSPTDLQTMLKHSSGSIVIRVEPGHQDMAGITELFVRAHFDYNPRQDRLIPSQDAGMSFRKGDIIKILNQEDSFWWQAIHYGDRSVAGLVPSQILEERRKAFNNLDARSVVGCLGKRKSKRKVMYSSFHSGLFESYDLVLYEPVVPVENFQYKTIVLIGAPNIGRRSLKTRLLSEYASRFGEVRPHTSRAPTSSDDHRAFYFVSEEEMKADISKHQFIEFGKSQNHYYGMKGESILAVIRSGRMCVLDVHPQALKLLRTAQFCPLIVFVKASNPEGVRKLHSNARVDNPSGHSLLSDEDYESCAKESANIEATYGHYFDATIINENIDIAYEELMATIRVFSTGRHWVPANWVM